MNRRSNGLTWSLRLTLLLVLMDAGGCAGIRHGSNAIRLPLPEESGRLLKVKAGAISGSEWPYYLYEPGSAERNTRDGSPTHLLVMPNNTGTDNDFRAQDRATLEQATRNLGLARDLGVILLVPAFPRPMRHWRVYTHALDRDALETRIRGLRRLDLQLEAMLDDAIERLARDGKSVERRVLMLGYSASGMFANRFTALHPHRILAAAIGSPGGWPIAPVGTWEGRSLRYPIGVHDLHSLTREEFDLESYRKVPHLFFIGAEDRNDSVKFGDSYEAADRNLILELFGPEPVDRWGIAERIHHSVGTSSEFRTYPAATS